LRLIHSRTPKTFLIDSGSDITIIKISDDLENDNINLDKTIKIKGITKDFTRSIGLLDSEIIIGKIAFRADFHVVSESFEIPTDGILGRDFLSYFKCILDYEQSLLRINYDLNGPNSLTVPFEDCSNINIISIPARSEVFREIPNYIQNTDDQVVLNDEIAPGVFVCSAIINKRNSIVKILNTTLHPVQISNPKFKYEKLSDFDIHSENNSTNLDELNRKSKIKSLILENNSKINNKAKEKLVNLIDKYSDVFALNEEQLTSNNFYKQKFRVSDDIPVYIKNYRTPNSQKSELNSQVENLLKNNIIEPSMSEYSSPIFLVPKKSTPGSSEKKWRLVVDFRQLNKKLLGDVYPIPRIDDILDQLGRAKYFSVLDLQCGFHQIGLDEESRDYTSFTTERGTFRFTRVPFGIKVAPNSFARMMSLAFSGLSAQQAFLYMDDLIVIGCSENHHCQNLSDVLQTCRKYNLKLNPQKCIFFKNEVTYLGHNCTSDGIKIDSNKLHAIKNYPIPISADETKRFVAFANYYRRFVKNFSIITAPLSKLTRKNTEFIWSDECQNSFDYIINCLCNPPILQYPNFEKQFIITTDASKIGCGAVLSQLHDDIDLPISYFSKTFSKGESNKSTIEQELLAIYFAIMHFRPYVYGTRFLIRSDHKPLVHLFSLKNPASRLTRIRLELEEYDFDVEYVKGEENVSADALSRISIESLKNLVEGNSEIFQIQTRSMTKNKNIINQSNDNKSAIISLCPYMKNLIKKKYLSLKVVFPKSSRNTMSILNEFNKLNSIPLEEIANGPENFFINFLTELDKLAGKIHFDELKIYQNDIIFQYISLEKFKNMANKYLNKVIIKICANKINVNDKNERLELIKKFHDDPITGGHSGQKRTLSKIKDKYSWKAMSKDIAKYVKNCIKCTKNKMRIKTKENLILTETPTKAFDIVQVDTIGPLPRTEHDNVYALTAQCELTSYVVIVPLPNKEARTIAKALVENVILIYGPMKIIKSDQGLEYCNNLVKNICDIFKINKTISTAYHHETVGKIERNHREINAYLRHYMVHGNDWDKWLPMYAFSYNTTPSPYHFYTPFELLFGNKANLPEDMFNSDIAPLYNPDDYAKDTQHKLKIALRRAREMIEEEKSKRKSHFDKIIKPQKITLNDNIYITNEARRKLDSFYEGPYKIIEILENNNIRVEDPKNKKQIIIHKNRIKPY
jgi:hypothetical protein